MDKLALRNMNNLKKIVRKVMCADDFTDIRNYTRAMCDARKMFCYVASAYLSKATVKEYPGCRQTSIYRYVNGGQILVAHYAPYRRKYEIIIEKFKYNYG